MSTVTLFTNSLLLLSPIHNLIIGLKRHTHLQALKHPHLFTCNHMATPVLDRVSVTRIKPAREVLAPTSVGEGHEMACRTTQVSIWDRSPEGGRSEVDCSASNITQVYGVNIHSHTARFPCETHGMVTWYADYLCQFVFWK